MSFVEIPLNKLKLSPANMRQGDVDCSDLIASFRARPVVLHNLRVTAEAAEGGKPTGFYLVHVGGRRFRAANAMVEMKLWKKTHPMPCAICEDEAEALAESIAENVLRLDPHPAQRFKAFKALADQGKSVAEIAALYGRTEIQVRRSLKLAVVSPRLFELYERDEMKFDQLSAFTVSDDHAAQEAAWFDAPPHSRWAHEIKRRLTRGQPSTEVDPLAKFVGLDAYREAGGTVIPDLFGDKDDSGFIGDAALLERLAEERLEGLAADVRAEGWKWVEVRVSLPYDFKQSLGVVMPQPVNLDPVQADQLKALKADLKAAMEAEDYDEADTLEERIAELEETEKVFTPAHLEIAGAIVTIGHAGADISRGWVKPGADTKALKALQRKAEVAGEAVEDTGAVASGAPKTRADGLSAPHAENLTAHRTLALRAEVMRNPRVALVATVHQLLNLTVYRQQYGATAKTAVVLGGVDHQMNVMAYGDDLASCAAQAALKAESDELRAKLPEKVADLWSFLMAQEEGALSGFLAYGIAQQLFAVNQGSEDSRSRVRFSHDIARAVGLDMADYWTADAAFFTRIPKAEILTAMREGAEVEVTPDLEKMKKGDLAARAVEVLEGKRWVPEILRTPPAVAGAEDGEQSPSLDEAA